MVKHTNWVKSHQYTPEMVTLACRVLEDIRSGRSVEAATRQYPLPNGGYLAKHVLVAAYRQMVDQGKWQPDLGLLERIRMKPVRTLSGVTTVTVLTRPYPCPGECIFCPDDARMPKSYLPNEPGARRGLEHAYDPYSQVASRIRALEDVGHPTDKIELLILGGTWSCYPAEYQEAFVQRCFEAMNGQESATLEAAHGLNESALHRNVGLAIETRPDTITPSEVARLRRLGVTKIQMGAQSMDDHILEQNLRGHTVQDTLDAAALLRAAGFKLVIHWMPNLLGATLESDRQDFAHLWEDLCPDEIKIYPTQLLQGTGLYQVWQQGQYTPYTTEELIELVADLKPTIPRYCRVNRVIRDIPSTEVVEGNKRTSLRLDIQKELARRGTVCACIRCREVRGQRVNVDTLTFDDLAYTAGGSEEHFLSFITPQDRIAGFLRLSLPGPNAPLTGLSDLYEAAIIREVHVYGQSLEIGADRQGSAQHAGLGTRLMLLADEIARSRGFPRMAVISAVGTRPYYLERGFERGNLYLVKDI